jgi:dipeptidyl aminopeptidase/acylaminoacyl peptidase
MLALVVAPALASATAAAQETPSETTLTVGHYFDLEEVSDPQISPDGSQIVYSRRWVNKLEDRYETTLWIMRADGTRNRELANGSSPQWSPDGTRIAYLADGGPKGSQIYVRYVDGDPGPTQVTHLTDAPSDIHWSPDGRSIGFTLFVPKPTVWEIDMPMPPAGAHWTASPRIVETLHFREDQVGFQDPGFRHLFVVSIDGGPARQITHGEWNVGARFDGLGGSVGWNWTPDGKTIIAEGWDAPDGDYQYRSSNLYAVDVNTGRTRSLTPEHGNWQSPVVSPDGKHIAYDGFAAGGKTYTTTGLYVMDIDGTHARALTESMDRDVDELHWAPDNSGIYFTIGDRGTQGVHFAPLTGTVRSIASGPTIVSLGSVSKTGVLAVTRATTDRPGDVARIDIKAKGNDVVQLTHVNDAALARIHLGTLEEIKYLSSGGAHIQGWIMKPPGFDPAKKYPLIVEIHGGPHLNYTVGFNYMFQNFAANDFVVIYVNPRGSTSYGSVFGAAISKAYPGVDYDDLMVGVDTVVARGYIDSKRLFVGGCSGGGTLSSWIIGHTTRFAAAAVRCPVTDWISMTGTTDIPLFAEGWFDKPFWEDPTPWLKESPLMYVGHVITPTLIMTGELDRRTPISQSEEFYVALKMRHVPATLLRFENEFHDTGGQKPTNFIRTQLYMMSWYKHWSAPTTSAPTNAGP